MHPLTMTTTAPDAADAAALWVEYVRLAEAASAATKTNSLAYQLLKNAKTDADRDRLRARVCGLSRDYLVLSAYVSAFRAAWLFASYGTESLFLTAMDEPAAVHHARR